MLALLILICGALAAAPAFANDSVAELGTGGLILSRTDAVSMLSENLSISASKVDVDYVFRNQTDQDVEAIVAFPMPDIAGSVYDRPSIPDQESDNFLGFEVIVDGKSIKPELQQKAIAVGIDVTELLTANQVPVNPFTQEALKALEGLSETVAQDWINRGLVFIDSYDDGAGWKNVRTPLWTLKSTYWWKSKFPAGQDVKVSHHYKPSVGGTSGLNFYYDSDFQGQYEEYKRRYCIDEAIEKAVRKSAAESKEGYPMLMEQRIEYVLTTGGNWALGNIGDFKLTIDKGEPDNIVSFCGENVSKTGPTTFEMTAKDFYPERDIAILILHPFSMDGDAPTAGPAGSRGVATGDEPGPGWRTRSGKD
jgi:hypothetical protein